MTSHSSPNDKSLEDSLLDRGLSAAFKLSASFKDPAVSEDPAAFLDHGTQTEPKTFANYRIQDVLGRGGMGVVYRAEQIHPKREVALKVIRSSHFSPELRWRFEQECLLLGRLQHPGIAQIFEAGTSSEEEGRQPFFAMELIKGKNLSQWSIDQSRQDKLALMAKIADAIHHAHQKGVIHRDLKPANILVDTHDQPKILDFGVARSADAEVSGTIATSIGQVVGTLPYMSPEQLTADPELMDTRSDTYSLGVILYELLTKNLPHDVKRKPVAEVARLVQETEPTSPTQYDTSLRGDLDTILRKALERDPQRRYSSAAAFAADIRRYLMNEPILARPATAFYQLRKFTLRHKAFVAAASAVMVALSLGLATSLSFARDANESATAALDAQNASIDEANKYRQIFELVENVIFAPSPYSRGHNVAFVTVLESLVNSLDQGLLDDDLNPEVQGKLRTLLGRSFYEFSKLDQAESQLSTAVDQLASLGNPDHPDLIKARMVLIKAQIVGGKYEEAKANYDSVYADALRILGPTDEQCLQLRGDLVVILYGSGRFEESLQLCESLIQEREELFGAKSEKAFQLMDNRANLLLGLGRTAEGLATARELVKLAHETYGKDNGHTVYKEMTLASILHRLGKFDESLSILKDVLDRCPGIFGERSLQEAKAYRGLSHSLRHKNRFDEALEAAKQSETIFRLTRGPFHPWTINARLDEVHILMDIPNHERARELLEGILADQRQHLDHSHPTLSNTLSLLGDCYRGMNQHQKSIPYYREALAGDRYHEAEDTQNALHTKKHLAKSLMEVNRLEEAATLYQEVIPLRIQDLGETHRFLAGDYLDGAECLIKLGRPEEALEYAELLMGVDIDRSLVAQYVERGIELLIQIYLVLEDRESLLATLELYLEEWQEGGGSQYRDRSWSTRLVERTLQGLIEVHEQAGDSESSAHYLEQIQALRAGIDR